MDAGNRNASPVPKSNPTKINMERVFEKERMTIATIDIKTNVRMILSLLQVSRILPPKVRPATSIIAIAEKKCPGLLIPHFIA